MSDPASHAHTGALTVTAAHPDGGETEKEGEREGRADFKLRRGLCVDLSLSLSLSLFLSLSLSLPPTVFASSYRKT